MTCFFSLYKEFVDDDYRKDRARGYPINEEFLSKRYECMLPEELIKDKTILDLGSCVSSLGAWTLHHNAKEYTGVECNKDLCDLAIKNLSNYFDNWNIIHTDVEYFLNTDNRHFDIIVASGILNYYYDQKVVLDKIVTKTKTLIIDSQGPYPIVSNDPVIVYKKRPDGFHGYPNDLYYDMILKQHNFEKHAYSPDIPEIYNDNTEYNRYMIRYVEV